MYAQRGQFLPAGGFQNAEIKRWMPNGYYYEKGLRKCRKTLWDEACRRSRRHGEVCTLGTYNRGPRGAKILHGNELVFTTGIAHSGTDWLLEFIMKLQEKTQAGLC